jgi:hypothetical protein
MKPHSTSFSGAFDDRDEVQQQARRRSAPPPAAALPEWMCQAGFIEPGLLRRLRRILLDEGQVVVDRARDHVEVEPLGRFGFWYMNSDRLSGAGIGQPFLDGQAVALGLGDLAAGCSSRNSS